MITVMRLSERFKIVVWLVQYNNRVYRVTGPRRARRDRLTEIRYAICKATRLDAADFRHVDNIWVNGQWISRWIEV